MKTGKWKNLNAVVGSSKGIPKTVDAIGWSRSGNIPNNPQRQKVKSERLKTLGLRL